MALHIMEKSLFLDAAQHAMWLLRLCEWGTLNNEGQSPARVDLVSTPMCCVMSAGGEGLVFQVVLDHGLRRNGETNLVKIGGSLCVCLYVLVCTFTKIIEKLH